MERYVKMCRDGTSPVPGVLLQPLGHLPTFVEGDFSEKWLKVSLCYTKIVRKCNYKVSKMTRFLHCMFPLPISFHGY